MLLLEDIEDLVRKIECQDEHIVIFFHDEASMKLAETSWREVGEFVVVASHFGCATSGEHAAYMLGCPS